MDCTLFMDDCLNILPELPDASVDLVACDLPYGVTRCSWDRHIPLGRLWDQYRRLLVPGGAVVLTATLSFAVQLFNTAPKGWFRYDLVWDKIGTTGYLDANRRPLRRHELILVFGPKQPKYRPQMTAGEPYHINRSANPAVYGRHARLSGSNAGTRYPTSVVSISNANFKRRGKLHSTEKPLDLMSWLVRTYSDPGDTVLDNAMGSGTTVVAALDNERHAIGIELDPTTFDVARNRIEASTHAFT